MTCKDNLLNDSSENQNQFFFHDIMPKPHTGIYLYFYLWFFYGIAKRTLSGTFGTLHCEKHFML